MFSQFFTCFWEAPTPIRQHMAAFWFRGCCFSTNFRVFQVALTRSLQSNQPRSCTQNPPNASMASSICNVGTVGRTAAELSPFHPFSIFFPQFFGTSGQVQHNVWFIEISFLFPSQVVPSEWLPSIVWCVQNWRISLIDPTFVDSSEYFQSWLKNSPSKSHEIYLPRLCKKHLQCIRPYSQVLH